MGTRSNQFLLVCYETAYRSVMFDIVIVRDIWSSAFLHFSIAWFRISFFLRQAELLCVYALRVTHKDFPETSWISTLRILSPDSKWHPHGAQYMHFSSYLLPTTPRISITSCRLWISIVAMALLSRTAATYSPSGLPETQVNSVYDGKYSTILCTYLYYDFITDTTCTYRTTSYRALGDAFGCWSWNIRPNFEGEVRCFCFRPKGTKKALRSCHEFMPCFCSVFSDRRRSCCTKKYSYNIYLLYIFFKIFVFQFDCALNLVPKI